MDGRQGTMAAMMGALASLAAACSSEGDPYLEQVRAELSSASFACGSERCSLGGEYCRVTERDEEAGGQTTYTCSILPMSCETRSICDCLGYPRCAQDRGRVIVYVP